MKKIFNKRNSIIIMIFILIIQLFFTCNVKAYSNEVTKISDLERAMMTDESDFSIAEEEVIMKYDAKTGITEKVDLEELKKELIKKGYNGENDVIKSYTPFELEKNIQSSNIKSTTTTYYNANMNTATARKICRIKADTSNGTLVATGFLVAKNIVATAAHCVMNQDANDAFYSNWVAYPGYNSGSSYGNASSGWAQVYYSSNWTSTHSPSDDWCICILNSSDMGVGWLGCQSYGTNAEMNGLSVKLQGYPYASGSGEIQKYTTGSIFNTTTYYFSSSAETTGGMSGSPFMRTSDDYAVGICHGYWTATPSTSIGVRFTQNMINIILNNS